MARPSSSRHGALVTPKILSRRLRPIQTSGSGGRTLSSMRRLTATWNGERSARRSTTRMRTGRTRRWRKRTCRLRPTRRPWTASKALRRSMGVPSSAWSDRYDAPADRAGLTDAHAGAWPSMMIRSSIDRRSWIPFHVIAVDPTSGGEAAFSEGPEAEAIIAACSIPGIFPGVVLVGGRLSADIARYWSDGPHEEGPLRNQRFWS